MPRPKGSKNRTPVHAMTLKDKLKASIAALPSKANDLSVGGTHYKDGSGCCPNCGTKLQHWDIVAMFGLDYFIGAATKYQFRYALKDGAQGLRKAIHYLTKKLELMGEKL